MIDLRYHVYSLAAVIAALAIGFVFGTSSLGKGADVKQVERIVNHYERSISSLRSSLSEQQDSLKTARADLNRANSLCAEMMPVILKGRLAYRNVAVVQTGDYDDLIPEIRAAIKDAGGNVTSVTRISPDFNFNDDNAVASVISKVGVPVHVGESGREALLRLVAEAVVGGRNKDKLLALRDSGVVELSGDYGRWNRLIVIAGGLRNSSAGRAGIVDAPLAESLSNLGVRVVCCEPSDAEVSEIQEWQRLDVSTVDSADKPWGRAALVFALAGEDGHFGQKRTAERLIPRIAETRL